MAKTIDSVLIADATSKLESIGISESFANLDLLDAIIEVARNIKKNGKAAFQKEEAAKRDIAKAEAFANGKKLMAKAEVGTHFIAIVGSGKFAKEYEFEALKIGENTVTVEYTEDNSPNGETGKRYINYAKIVRLA